MNFTFHRIPVGICNCYLLRGERTVLIDAGAQGSINPMGIKQLHPAHGMDFLVESVQKEISNFEGSK